MVEDIKNSIYTVRFHGGMNARFFDGTVVEEAAKHGLQDDA
jgi:hypothetical protein